MNFSFNSLQAVIFDLDGVLVDSMKYHVISYKKALLKFNVFPTKQELFLLEGMSGQATIDLLIKRYHPKTNGVTAEDIYQKKKEFLAEDFKVEFYPGVLTFLDYLKEEGILLGLVTGSNKEFLAKVLDKKVRNFFETIVTCEDAKRGKPFPDPYLEALNNLGLNDGEVFVIENAPLGIQSSQRAGLTTFALTTTLNKKYLKAADRIFKNHQELFSFIREGLTNK